LTAPSKPARSKPIRGAVAAGHPETARAAMIMLEEGGNAFDAVMAAMTAACVTEPVLCSMGGGGFLLAQAAGKPPRLLDFFVQTPGRRVDPENADFQPILCDFGTVQQEFHVGRASSATPGCVKGLFEVAEHLGRMPVKRVVEPALQLAREGVRLNRLQAYIFDVVGPIYMITEPSRRIFESKQRPGELVGEGESVANPDFADFLESLAIEGEDLFYRGEVSAVIDAESRAGGAALRRADLESYELALRDPLEIAYGGARLYTNPPPSTGGILIAFALKLYEQLRQREWSFGDAERLDRMIQVMAATNEARMESGLHELTEDEAAVALLGGDLLQRYGEEILGRPKAYRGTTHISVIDGQGNAVALTLSNGEGSGHIVPGTGVMLNNMLGEEDLNPGGFHAWRPGTRMCSMMAPTLVREADGRLTALGSGGSNRIRTAILQVLMNLLDFSMPLADAIEAPRCHFEQGLLNIEAGYSEAAVQRLSGAWPEVKAWDERNLFFGGVHAVRADPARGELAGAGDPRRGGAALSR
jgi:gamma-glutamyltranspeptidase/glutathione hydrolase